MHSLRDLKPRLACTVPGPVSVPVPVTCACTCPCTCTIVELISSPIKKWRLSDSNRLAVERGQKNINFDWVMSNCTCPHMYPLAPASRQFHTSQSQGGLPPTATNSLSRSTYSYSRQPEAVLVKRLIAPYPTERRPPSKHVAWLEHRCPVPSVIRLSEKSPCARI